ncbi:carboxylesterase/lipase family protein [Granulicella sp. WH15]|uniref:carboxylesterase/lipase family protein n=1 Tax=Granulicella sp. WH15 TaxID=2602070 RepID=UPI0013A535B8|nr:carboxylesterase/lipase family protein [Granulicella sp. WH15]
MKKKTEKQTNRPIDEAPASPGRRTFVGGIASLSAASLFATPIAHSQNATSVSRSRVSAQLSASDATTITETTTGKLRGYRRNGIYTFKGVPYGASTSGTRRFMPPAKPEPWAGVRNALQYGRVCLNRDSAHFITDGHNSASSDEDSFVLHRGAAAPVMGEDCLRVNVWTPEINGTHKRPVMVFMHGGGYTSGNAHELLSYDGENLARNHDIVTVTNNHRLNVFGYLNLASLGGKEFAESANVGLLDLVAVLEWVRDNIVNFGGDPNNVTIFGQSGGGGKVLALMAMPAAKGLFHRAIVQSGPYLKVLPPEYSARVAELVLKELGLSPSQVDQLQQVSVDRLEGAGVEAIKKMPDIEGSPLRRSFGLSGWGPTADGLVLPQHPFDPAAPAISASVPMITGTNLNEFINGVDRPNANSMSLAELHRLIQQGLGDKSQAIIEAYRRDYPKANPFSLYATIAASSVRHGSFEQARRKAALHSAPVYSYIYSWRTPVLDDRPGPFHAAELAFVFDNADICDHYSAGSPEASALSRQMSTAWVNFARTGNPNHNSIPHWPEYTAENPATMYFNTPCEVRIDAEGEGLRLIAHT